MKIYTAIIIDDEKLARDIIKNYLSEQEDIEILGEFEDGFSGLKAINELKPEIVFLDIQMPKLSGFEVLEMVDSDLKIIFTTAFDNYAIKAFEYSATDYLLKPFSKDRFNKALKKIINTSSTHEIEKLKNNALSNCEQLNRIVVKDGDTISIIDCDDIYYIEANDDYVFIYTKETKYIKYARMKEYEKLLDPAKFLRIHRSYIVQINKIKKIFQHQRIELDNGAEIIVSRSKLKELKEVLNI